MKHFNFIKGLFFALLFVFAAQVKADENILVNGGFEEWSAGALTAWGKDGSNASAHSATIAQSTDACSGSYAVEVSGNSSSNKRLASKAYTLAAGTYTLSAYIKQSGEAAGKFRLGYAVIKDGKIGNSDYHYLNDPTSATEDWECYSAEFTLEEETTVSILVMNNKLGNGASFLVDDVVVTGGNGETPEQPEEPEEPEIPVEPETPAGVYISEALTSSFGTFTTQETVGNYPWEIATKYQCAKVTGYKDSANAAESWMVSKSFDLSKETAAYISFDYLIAYNSDDINGCHKVVFSHDYAGDVSKATWKEIDYSPVKSGVGVWTLKNTGKIAIPSEMYGKENVVVAFKYTSSASNASTWEVANVVVASGTGNAPEQPETPVEPETPVVPAGEYISEAFTNGFGSFTTQETVGNYPWVSDAQYGAKASGYADGASQDAESWLISSAMDFSKETEAYIAFDYVINKGDASAAAANHKLLITTSYTGDVATTEWSEVDYGAVNNNSWDFHNTGDIALPASVMGEAAVVFAFKYMSTTANSSTWEIKNLVVTSATGNAPEQPEEPETPVEPETPEIVVGENILLNSGFEEWNGDVPTAWGNDGSNASAHSATIAQSTDSNSGIYAVEVAGASGKNKRLASKAYTLPAGTYTLSAYIKQSGEAEGAFKLGYAIIKNGTIADGDYKYLHKEHVTATEEWEYYAVEFTLEEETTVSILVMNNNAGKGASFLVDDVELVASNITAVEVTVEDCDAVSVYYDLSGRVVKNPANGIYICNGKKVLVK